MSFGTDHTVNGLEFHNPTYECSTNGICKHGLIPKTTPPNNEIRSISTGGPKKSRQREIKHVTSIRHWCLRIRWSDRTGLMGAERGLLGTLRWCRLHLYALSERTIVSLTQAFCVIFLVARVAMTRFVRMVLLLRRY